MGERIGVKKAEKLMTREELLQLNKGELVDQLLSLRAHNLQLKNILSKGAQSRKQSKYAANLGKEQKTLDFSKYTFRHVLLKFYYLGWDYHGYVVQEDTTNTIEHCLFEALLKTCLIKSREESNYHRCGRTDKGVSSFGQVISIDLRSKLTSGTMDKLEEEINYCQILNRVLPDNIRCVAWHPVNNGFSARYDCKYRTYKYFFPKGTLNIDKMKAACEYLIGAHDFRNLCKMDVANGVTEFIRSIEGTDIQRFDNNCGNLLDTVYTMYVLNIKSRGFLWHQIRCIMGVLLLIGEDKEEPEIVKELLDISRNPRKPDYNMASELPLNLFHSEYDCGSLWYYDSTTLKTVMRTLQGQWTFAKVKTTMMEAMLDELGVIAKSEESDFPNVLNHDNKTKRHVPLMHRPKCDSLEIKVERYLKRRKLEIKREPAHKDIEDRTNK